ncbi:MAG TPA: hypothetical protein VHM26_05960 [Chitinophagaceae bacterium]|jgi:hypothetical protein|nr:hypothetical protein [Chitinophagaceae bacterium]
MKRLKDDVMKLSKAEQYEIYVALGFNLFGEQPGQLLTKQSAFINTRSNPVDSQTKYMNQEQLRKDLDNMIG